MIWPRLSRRRRLFNVKELFQVNYNHIISDKNKKKIRFQVIYDGLQSLSKIESFFYADWQTTDSKYFSNLVGSNTTF